MTVKFCCDLVGLFALIDEHQYLVSGRPTLKRQCVHLLDSPSSEALGTSPRRVQSPTERPLTARNLPSLLVPDASPTGCGSPVLTAHYSTQKVIVAQKDRKVLVKFFSRIGCVTEDALSD